MLAKDLMEILSKLPPNARIVLSEADSAECYAFTTEEQPSYNAGTEENPEITEHLFILIRQDF